ncbi:hypothetical protein GCM10011608_32710 [Micromonospora sonchi]|uniref:Transposase n=1 Tax=Micromonospora sonchi TaxID=1763543 RepID=A0A917X044_9ACTN|nr:zinc ribbon domain-containing protein [Micromonospora sonchi]GGM45411.1 hypothetical protein GCM10011608_32710 [Micromonospora sonchi]
MKAIQAYRYALDLTPAQERAALAHAGAARVAHNWALARVAAVMNQRAAERTYGVADADLTPAIGWSLPALRKAWNAPKDEAAPWWRECSKEAFNTGLDALARALKNWSDSRTGKRAGRPVGFPRFKSRRRSVPSVRFTTGPIRVEPDRKHVVLPRLGRLKLHGFGELRRQLAYKTQWNGGRLIVADRWYPSSKTCSGCGAVKTKLALSERTYTCTTCGMVLDRDLNAARNLAALATGVDTAGSGPVTGRGADRKTRPGGQVATKRQPGTAIADQTGTVPPQGRTTDHVLARAH